MTLGDLVVFKTHPYAFKINPIKISANALFTPPVMIVTEVVYKDSDKKEQTKAKCLYYNSSINRLHSDWFPVMELEKITFYSELTDSEFVENAKYTLKSSIHELKKMKAIYEIENSRSKSFATSLLCHLPPVFVVSEKVALAVKGNQQVKDFCSHGYKVKWFSPDTGKFKEDIIPSVALARLTEPSDLAYIPSLIENKELFQYALKSPISLPSNRILTMSLFRVIDIRYNHISVVLKVFDILFKKEFEMPLEEFEKYKHSLRKPFNSYFTERYPKLENDKFTYPHELVLKPGHLYEMSYRNRAGEKTERSIIPIRLIKLASVDDETKEDKVIEAFCLLRRGVRYFWPRRIESLYLSTIQTVESGTAPPGVTL